MTFSEQCARTCPVVMFQDSAVGSIHLRERLSKPPPTGPQHWSLGRQKSKTDKGPILTLLSAGGDLGQSRRLPEPQRLHV